MAQSRTKESPQTIRFFNICLGKTMRGSTFLTVASCVLLLTACGGAPSASQMQEALQAQIKQDQAQMTKFAGSGIAGMVRNMTPELQALHKIGCKEDGENAWRCDVELEMKQGGSVQKSPANFRFVKASSGWAVSR